MNPQLRPKNIVAHGAHQILDAALYPLFLSGYASRILRQ
ncbi:hypothetical protein FQV37_2797 [Psychrobacter nivimaris]|uniref:Uncharacterized protein n=1 Tax=Psychrobacter nivimaris TaxID=281738 RepID=A0A6N7C1S0_9GAMM|nr:hypothetical protein FQV37_2797 [Psychrobacter nivimaris]